MINYLKKFINYSNDMFDVKEMKFSKDGDEVEFLRVIGKDSYMEYHIKVVDQKKFKNDKNNEYKVTFFKENIDKDNEIYIVAFIEIENEKFITICYGFENDQYMISNLDGLYIFGGEREEERISDEITEELRLIIKQSFDYIENYNKKRIQRLLNPEETDEAIQYIEEYM